VDQVGKRILQLQTLDATTFPTEKALRQHLSGFIEKLNNKAEYARSVCVTFNVILDRYVKEEMPSRHSTKGSYLSMIGKVIRHRWGTCLISEIRPADLHAWLRNLDIAPVTKEHLRSKMHHLFDLAIRWGYLPLGQNPTEIVKIKNVTRRTKESVLVLTEQFRNVAVRLPANVKMVVITMACLGLCVSEALGLKWSDIDPERRMVTISRSAYRGAIDEAKTLSSRAELPLHPILAELLKAWITEISLGHGKVESRERFPLFHTPDCGEITNSNAALH